MPFTSSVHCRRPSKAVDDDGGVADDNEEVFSVGGGGCAKQITEHQIRTGA